MCFWRQTRTIWGNIPLWGASAISCLPGKEFRKHFLKKLPPDTPWKRRVLSEWFQLQESTNFKDSYWLKSRTLWRNNNQPTLLPTSPAGETDVSLTVNWYKNIVKIQAKHFDWPDLCLIFLWFVEMQRLHRASSSQNRREQNGTEGQSLSISSAQLALPIGPGSLSKSNSYLQSIPRSKFSRFFYRSIVFLTLVYARLKAYFPPRIFWALHWALQAHPKGLPARHLVNSRQQYKRKKTLQGRLIIVSPQSSCLQTRRVFEIGPFLLLKILMDMDRALRFCKHPKKSLYLNPTNLVN